MLYWNGKVTKNYNWELDFFRFIRRFRDGITFFEFEINWDRYKDDHSPKFGVSLHVMNFTIFEFNIYANLHHYNSE